MQTSDLVIVAHGFHACVGFHAFWRTPKGTPQEEAHSTSYNFDERNERDMSDLHLKLATIKRH